LKKDKRPKTRPPWIRRACSNCWPKCRRQQARPGQILGLKGSDRIQLKRILKELKPKAPSKAARKGFVKARRTAGSRLIEVTGLDDGRRNAGPSLNWDSNEEPPPIYVIPPKDGARRAWRPAAGAAGTAWRELTKPASSAGWSAKRPPA
jgi:hypothetical protein